MNSFIEIPVEELRRRFHCNFSTGTLTWKACRPDYLGRIVGTKRKDGYLGVMIQRKSFLVHRIIWAMSKGRWPEIFIDHKNRKRTDNRLKNLREANATQNASNASDRKNSNFCIAKGVHPHQGRYRAYINLGKRRFCLGLHKTIEEAIAIRKDAEALFFGEYRC